MKCPPLPEGEDGEVHESEERTRGKVRERWKRCTRWRERDGRGQRIKRGWSWREGGDMSRGRGGADEEERIKEKMKMEMRREILTT